MTVVTGIVSDLEAVPVEDAVVAVMLLTFGGMPGFHEGEDCGGVATVITGVDGAYAFDLVPNDEIDPIGSVYVVKEIHPDGRTHTFKIVVPSSGGPYTAQELLVPPDTTPAQPAFVGPAGPPGPEGPEGPPGAGSSGELAGSSLEKLPGGFGGPTGYSVFSRLLPQEHATVGSGQGRLTAFYQPTDFLVTTLGWASHEFLGGTVTDGYLALYELNPLAGTYALVARTANTPAIGETSYTLNQLPVTEPFSDVIAPFQLVAGKVYAFGVFFKGDGIDISLAGRTLSENPGVVFNSGAIAFFVGFSSTPPAAFDSTGGSRSSFAPFGYILG